jgi:uncharacterized membrane protein YdfJ with MMPL/SSD domain
VLRAGIGLGVAVDATLVRLILAPATMTLLGEWNRSATRPLRRLYPRWAVREAG